MRGVGDDQVGLGRPAVGEPENLVTDRHPLHTGTDLDDTAGEVTALTGGERGRPAGIEQALPDGDLSGIDAGADHLDQHLADGGSRTVNLDDPQLLDRTIAIEPDSTRHRNSSKSTAPYFDNALAGARYAPQAWDPGTGPPWGHCDKTTASKISGDPDGVGGQVGVCWPPAPGR
jgi:hypothetical protein